MYRYQYGDVEPDETASALFACADQILAVVFLSPEAAEPPLGLSPPEFYVGSRAAPLGPVPGAVIAAVFGVINPRPVLAVADRIWAVASPEQLLDTRLEMATTVLSRELSELGGLPRALDLLTRAIEGAPIEGHPLFAALRSLASPDDELGRLWRACDLVREHRGDAHVNAWRAAGLDGAETNVLTELWRGKRPGSEAAVVNGWTADDVERAVARLEAHGLAEGDRITDQGRALREDIERATSLQQYPLVAALGHDAAELLALLRPWAAQLRDALRPPYWWHLAAAR